jgi:hypothetical protein
MNLLKIRSYAPEDIEDVVTICNKSFKNLRSCWPNPMALEWFVNRFGTASAQASEPEKSSREGINKNLTE